MPSTELVEWEAANQESGIPEPVLQLARKLDLVASVDESGTSSATLDIMAQILSAGSAEEVFAASNAGATSAKDFVGIPFKFKAEDLTWKRSAAVFRENGNFPFYMLIRAINLSTGEEVVLTCGSPNLVSVIWTLGTLGYFEKMDKEDDGASFIIDSKTTGSGFTQLLIRPFKLAASSGKKAS